MTGDYQDPQPRRPQRHPRQTAAAEKIVNLAAGYRACFTSSAGTQVLADLERCYARGTVGRSPRQTELRAAQREVLLRILDLMEIAAEERGAALRALSGAPATMTTLLEPWSSYER